MRPGRGCPASGYLGGTLKEVPDPAPDIQLRGHFRNYLPTAATQVSRGTTETCAGTLLLRAGSEGGGASQLAVLRAAREFPRRPGCQEAAEESAGKAEGRLGLPAPWMKRRPACPRRSRDALSANPGPGVLNQEVVQRDIKGHKNSIRFHGGVRPVRPGDTKGIT